MLENYFSTVFDLYASQRAIQKDYLCLNVIYDATVGLQVRISTTQLSLK